MAAQQPGWYTDPLDDSRVRWWDGQRWGEHTHELQPGANAARTNAPDSVEAALLPGEPALIAPPSSIPAHSGHPVRTEPLAVRPAREWGDPSIPPAALTQEPSDQHAAPPKPSAVPRVGLALIVVLLIAGGVGLWSWWADRRGEDSAAALTEEPDPSSNGEAIPSFIDQPWVRTAPPGGSISFEFPGTHATTTSTGPGGRATSSIVAGSTSPSDTLGAVACSVVADAPPSGPPLDQSTVADAALAQAGVEVRIGQFIDTAVGPATQFAGTAPTNGTTVRGIAVGAGDESLWCVVTLAAGQDTLADLTLQRIVSTLQPA